MTDYEASKIDDLARAIRSSKNTTRSNPVNVIDIILVGGYIYIAIKMFMPYMSQAVKFFEYLK